MSEKSIEFYIRTARKDDLPGILDVEKESGINPWNEKAFKIELSKNSCGENIFFAAKDNNTDIVLGFICGDIVADFAGILNIAVAEKFRKSGIGTALMERFDGEARGHGLKRVTLEVREDNEPALKLYKRKGFIVEGKREKYYLNKHDALLMWKDL